LYLHVAGNFAAFIAVENENHFDIPYAQVDDQHEDEGDQNYCEDIFLFIFDLQSMFSVSSIHNVVRFIAEIERLQRRAGYLPRR
jgi:hypothetical protein